jgi:hypothetical protein
MKPRQLLSISRISLLAVLSDGCVSNYGPASPDYYPQFYAPYFECHFAGAGDSEPKIAEPRSLPALDTGQNQFVP